MDREFHRGMSPTEIDEALIGDTASQEHKPRIPPISSMTVAGCLQLKPSSTVPGGCCSKQTTKTSDCHPGTRS